MLGPCAQLEREGVEVTRVRIGASGIVDPDDIRRALRPETALISIMHANNELGTIQPIAEIAAIAREAGVPLHVDGVQALGKIPVNVRELGVDLYSISAHKLYAPKGVGALYVRKGMKLCRRDLRRPARARPAARHGERSGDRRLRRRGRTGGAHARLDSLVLRDRLESAVLERIPGTRVNGSRAQRTPNTTNI